MELQQAHGVITKAAPIGEHHYHANQVAGGRKPDGKLPESLQVSFSSEARPLEARFRTSTLAGSLKPPGLAYRGDLLCIVVQRFPASRGFPDQAGGEETGLNEPYIFPGPIHPDRPISTVKSAWKAALRRAGVSLFPRYPCGTSFVLVSARLLPTPLCGARCGTQVRKPSAGIS